METIDKTGLYKLLLLRQKRKDADEKLRNEILKMGMRSQLTQEKKRQDPKSAALYTPQQEYLRRRALEINPIASMSIPEEGQPMTGIQYPQNVVGKGSSGMFEEKPLTQDTKTSMFLQKIDQMLQEGRKPHPVAMMLADKMRQNQAQRADKATIDPETGNPIPTGKPEKEINPSAVTNKVLSGLADDFKNGVVRDQGSALRIVQQNEKEWKLRGVDLDHVRSKIMEALPEKASKEKSSIGDILSKFGIGQSDSSNSETDLVDTEDQSF